MNRRTTGDHATRELLPLPGRAAAHARGATSAATRVSKFIDSFTIRPAARSGRLAELVPAQFFFWYQAICAGPEALIIAVPTVAFRQ